MGQKSELKLTYHWPIFSTLEFRFNTTITNVLDFVTKKWFYYLKSLTRLNIRIGPCWDIESEAGASEWATWITEQFLREMKTTRLRYFYKFLSFI